MPNKIVFFNYYHNGDVHVSRGFVRQIMNKVHSIDPTIQFAYSHKNDPTLLADIPNLGFDHSALGIVRNDHANLHVVGDTVYINTWYGQQHHKYMNRHGGINIDAIYDAFSESCQTLWGFSLEDISTDASVFFPIVDYSKFNIESVKTWLDNHPGQKILVENGKALSDQATNFPMGPIIVQLARQYPDKCFILTSQENMPSVPSNIFYSSQITNKGNKSDLNQISFLSTHCDVIVGRSSGVFAFTINQDNLFKRNIKFLNFSNLVPIQPNKYWLGDKLRDKITYSSTIISTNESDTNKVLEIIKGNL